MEVLKQLIMSYWLCIDSNSIQGTLIEAYIHQYANSVNLQSAAGVAPDMLPCTLIPPTPLLEHTV